MRNIIAYFSLFISCLFVVGCTGVQTFGTAARAGDTIAIATGWNQDLTSSDYAIQITDSMGVVTPVQARAVINAYPDPLSNLIIQRYSDNSGSLNSGYFWAPRIEEAVTNGDRDFSQQIVYLDLPLTLNPGPATINISGPGYNPALVDLEVIEGTGSSNTFEIQETLPETPTISVNFNTGLGLAERAPHYTITFTGSRVPHAIEVTFTHDPDLIGGGTSGVTYVTSPRADIKNISWSDTGTQLTVIMTPSRLSPFVSITDLVDYKFYVAGGITGLTNNTVAAYDVDGNPISGIGCEIDGITC